MTEEYQAEFLEKQEKKLLNFPFFGDLNKYLIDRFGSGCMIHNRTLNELDSQLYSLNIKLRFNNCVSIDRIGFTHPRQGHCESLINFIDSVSENHQIPLIMFGGVGTESMNNFVKKHRFIETPPMKLDDGKIRRSGCWYRFTPYGEDRHKFSKISLESDCGFIFY